MPGLRRAPRSHRVTHALQILLILAAAAAAAAGTCHALSRPPGPAGDDHGPAEGRSYGAVNHPPRKDTRP